MMTLSSLLQQPMDLTVLVALITATATLAGVTLGAILNHVLTSKRDQKRWEREQEGDRIKWEREREWDITKRIMEHKMKGANLSGFDLRGYHLAGADMEGADLGQADLTGVDLRGANLVNALLVGTKLEGANLIGANLSGARLNGVDLSKSDLYNIKLKGAVYRENVVWPDNFDPAGAGAVLEKWSG